MFETVFLFSEAIIIVLFGLCTDYKMGMGINDVSDATQELVREDTQTVYPMWQDIHVMVYIGYGFLMVYLKTHSWTAVGFNFLLSAFAFQIAILIVPFWHMVFKNKFERIPLNVDTLVVGDFAAAACMICYGALLGKADLFQMWLLLIFLVIFYGLNEGIGVEVFGAIDNGGAMFIHTFGAYFGLTASYFFHSTKAVEDKELRAVGGYTSQYVAMAGTIFLYLYWPSFNAALANPISQQRIIINTALAISASCIGACATARLIYCRLDMEIMLNATIAGGVIIAACCEMVVDPFAAIILGSGIGIISSLGYAYLSKALQKAIGLHDTCGINNRHGIPGILGGFMSAIFAATAGRKFSDAGLKIVFPKVGDARSLQQ